MMQALWQNHIIFLPGKVTAEDIQTCVDELGGSLSDSSSSQRSWESPRFGHKRKEVESLNHFSNSNLNFSNLANLEQLIVLQSGCKRKLSRLLGMFVSVPGAPCSKLVTFTRQELPQVNASGSGRTCFWSTLTPGHTSGELKQLNSEFATDFSDFSTPVECPCRWLTESFSGRVRDASHLTMEES